MKIKIQHKLIIFIFILIVLLITASTIFQTDQYADFDKAIQNPNKSFQIIANIDKSKEIIINNDSISFNAIDKLGKSIPVIHYGKISPEFKKTDKVVLNGYFSNNKFFAKKFLLKCPTKYTTPQKNMK